MPGMMSANARVAIRVVLGLFWDYIRVKDALELVTSVLNQVPELYKVRLPSDPGLSGSLPLSYRMAQLNLGLPC